MGIVIFMKRQVVAERLLSKLNKLWVVSEIFLFVLVGASVKIETISSLGLNAILVLLLAMIF